MNRRTIVLTLTCALLLTLTVPVLASETTTTYGVPAEVIAAYAEPNVTQLYARDALLHDRAYRRVNEAIDIYDAPNGNYLRTLAKGFNFFTTYRNQDGWVEIGRDNWVRAEALGPSVYPSTFAGVLLPDEELPYTMAWLLVHVYPSRVPGGDPSERNPRLLRYTKVSIYAEVEIEGWRWYQIGVDQWVHQTQVAKVLPIERPEGLETERWVSVDLYEQVLIAYEGETPVFSTLVATGLPNFSTREGLFHIHARYPRGRMSWLEGTPNFYYLQEVPYIQYFDGMIGLHGAYWHDGFGYRRSRGCVNLSITDAHWLYRWVDEVYTGKEADEFAVYVYSSGEYRQ